MSEARNRIKLLFDNGEFTELNKSAKSGDNDCEVITAFGCVHGNPCYAFSQDITVNNGAMGTSQAAKILRVYELAEKTGYPVVGIYDSNGAHIDEGIAAVDAYSKLIDRSSRLSGVVPQISVIAGVCAASSAMLALCADLVVMAQDASLFITPSQFTGDDKVGTAKAAVANGTAHICAESAEDAVQKAADLIGIMPSNNLCASAAFESAPSSSSITADADAKAKVLAVADEGSFIEIQDGFGTSSVAAFATVNGVVSGVCAAGNSDRLSENDCKKIASFVRLCDSYSIPVITLVDTEGFDESAENELGGMAKCAAMLTKAYAEATTPKITVITGKAYGPAYLIFAGKAANADAVFAYDSAVISTLRPETAVSILYNDRILAGEDRQTLIDEYISTTASAKNVAASGFVDDVIAPSDTVASIMSAMDMLLSKRISTLDKKHANFIF